MASKHAIQWVELPDKNTGWTTWVTDCGRYRIDGHTLDRIYTPQRLQKEDRLPGGSHYRTYVPVAADKTTLDEAMNAINVYHCNTYNLVMKV